MEKLPTQSNAKVYYELQGGQCLNDILPGRTIIEFPTIHVVLAFGSGE